MTETEPRATLEVIDVIDTPLFIVRTLCSCGAVVASRTYDVEKDSAPGVDGEADALAFLAHLAEVHS